MNFGAWAIVLKLVRFTNFGSLALAVEHNSFPFVFSEQLQKHYFDRDYSMRQRDCRPDPDCLYQSIVSIIAKLTLTSFWYCLIWWIYWYGYCQTLKWWLNSMCWYVFPESIVTKVFKIILRGRNKFIWLKIAINTYK